jgi:hypothetical protein
MLLKNGILILLKWLMLRIIPKNGKPQCLNRDLITNIILSRIRRKDQQKKLTLAPKLLKSKLQKKQKQTNLTNLQSNQNSLNFNKGKFMSKTVK